MNRGERQDLTFLNTPTTVGTEPSTFLTAYARPDPVTLAPLFTPQVPLVSMQQHIPPYLTPPFVATMAPTRIGPGPTYTIILIALAIILVLWTARLLFFSK